MTLWHWLGESFTEIQLSDVLGRMHSRSRNSSRRVKVANWMMLTLVALACFFGGRFIAALQDLASRQDKGIYDLPVEGPESFKVSGLGSEFSVEKAVPQADPIVAPTNGVESLQLENIPFFDQGKENVFGFDDAPFRDELVPDYLSRIKPRMDFAMNDMRAKGTIFVSIPSYRDALCKETLKHLFERAERPERVFVGLCDQVHPQDVDEVCTPPEEFKNQVRTVRIPVQEARGPTFARYLISKLWDGEEFWFSLDAHSNFLHKWDSILVDMMRRHPYKSIVSHYPPATEPQLGEDFGRIPWLCKVGFGKGAPQGLVIQECGECHPQHRGKNNLTCMAITIGAGFYFGRSLMIYDAPFDKYLDYMFQGEELLLASRLWTAGWDFYSPTTNVICHKYGSRKHSVFFEDRSPSRNEKEMRSHARATWLLGSGTLKPDPAPEIEHLGMGSVRTLKEYFEFSGIDLIGRKMEKMRCYQRYNFETKSWEDL